MEDQNEAGARRRKRAIQQALSKMSRSTLQRLVRQRLDNEGAHSDTSSDSDSGEDIHLPDNVAAGVSTESSSDSASQEDAQSGSSDGEVAQVPEQHHLPEPVEQQEHQLLENEALAQALQDVSDSDTPGETSSSDTSDSETDSDEDVGPPPNPHGDERLHAETNITTGKYVLLILQLYMKNRVTKSCLADILNLISVALPQPNNLPNTKYKLLKFLEAFVRDFNYKRHRFCENTQCYNYLGRWEDTKELIECPECGCNSLNGLFIENSIESLVRHCFEQRRLYKYFQPNNSGLVDGKICDITGGQKYREANIGRGEFDITFLFNTDGVPVFKSSNAQLWPILLTICELEPKKRKENVLVAGLWFGSCKPEMNTYTKPFVDSLRRLHDIGGVQWDHPETGIRIKSKVIGPAASVDSIARAPLQNITQFNGEYGCSGCEHPGEDFPRVYPFLAEAPPLRTNVSMNQQAIEAIRTGRRVKGVKGLAYVSLIPYFDMGKSFIPEYMHGGLLGGTRQLLNLWLDSSSHMDPWYIGLRSREIDGRLLTIYPPNDINRVPRSVARRPHWKASEYRNWLLYYSCIVLSEILPPPYLQHWICYVGAMYLLLQQSISQADIAMASALLKSFVGRIEDLYGTAQNKYNMHLHLHFAESVQNWGPLWATSLFPFENENGQLLRLVHGTQQVSEQLIATNKMLIALQVLKNKCNLEDHAEQDDNPINGVVLGKLIPAARVPLVVIQEIRNFYRLNEPPNSSARVHSQIALKGQGVVSSFLYAREKKRNSYTIAFREHNEKKFGKVECFVKYEQGGIYCIVRRLLPSEENPVFVDTVTQYALKHVIHVNEVDELVHVRPLDILQKVVRVHEYVCLQPNNVEKNL